MEAAVVIDIIRAVAWPLASVLSVCIVARTASHIAWLFYNRR